MEESEATNAEASCDKIETDPNPVKTESGNAGVAAPSPTNDEEETTEDESQSSGQKMESSAECSADLEPMSESESGEKPCSEESTESRSIGKHDEIALKELSGVVGVVKKSSSAESQRAGKLSPEDYVAIDIECEYIGDLRRSNQTSVDLGEETDSQAVADPESSVDESVTLDLEVVGRLNAFVSDQTDIPVMQAPLHGRTLDSNIAGGDNNFPGMDTDSTLVEIQVQNARSAPNDDQISVEGVHSQPLAEGRRIPSQGRSSEASPPIAVCGGFINPRSNVRDLVELEMVQVRILPQPRLFEEQLEGDPLNVPMRRRGDDDDDDDDDRVPNPLEAAGECVGSLFSVNGLFRVFFQVALCLIAVGVCCVILIVFLLFVCLFFLWFWSANPELAPDWIHKYFGDRRRE